MYNYLYMGLFVLIAGASTSYIPYREMDHFITIPTQVDSSSSSSSHGALTLPAAETESESDQQNQIQDNKVEIQLHSVSSSNSLENIQNDVNRDGYDDDDEDYGESDRLKLNSVHLPPQLGVYFQHLPQHQQQLYRDYYAQQKQNQQQQNQYRKKPEPFTYNYKHRVVKGGNLRKRYPTHLDPFMQAKMWFRSGECPVAPDGARQFFCPTPTVDGIWNCVDDHELCDGVKTCPNAEDENTLVCMFYKAMQSQINYVANGISQSQKTESDEDA